ILKHIAVQGGNRNRDRLKGFLAPPRSDDDIAFGRCIARSARLGLRERAGRGRQCPQRDSRAENPVSLRFIHWNTPSRYPIPAAIALPVVKIRWRARRSAEPFVAG